MPERAVFDCVLFLQAVLSDRGPAFECFKTFIEKFKSIGAFVPAPRKAFALPRDPKDEPYTDLAIAVNAAYLVTWNERHLTYLMARDTLEGQEFCQRFPGLTILPPPAFLQKLRVGGQEPS